MLKKTLCGIVAGSMVACAPSSEQILRERRQHIRYDSFSDTFLSYPWQGIYPSSIYFENAGFPKHIDLPRIGKREFVQLSFNERFKKRHPRLCDALDPYLDLNSINGDLMFVYYDKNNRLLIFELDHFIPEHPFIVRAVAKSRMNLSRYFK
ncbi:MAG: hypothetical protein QW331_02200 [Candidatus Woesearchaeota archaeon]